MRCGLERGRHGEEFLVVAVVDDFAVPAHLCIAGQHDRLWAFGGAGDDGPRAVRIRRRERDAAGRLRQRAELFEQRVVDRHAGRDERDGHRRAHGHHHDPVDATAERRQRGALAARRRIVEEIGIGEGVARVARGARVGGDAAVETDQHHARGADPVAVIAQGRQLGRVVVLRDGLAQRVVEREHLHVVADALGEDAELAQENMRRRGELRLLLVDEAVAQERVGHHRGQHLDRRQRRDQEQSEALTEAHGPLNSPICASGSCSPSACRRAEG